MRFAYHASMCAPDQYLPLARAVEAAGFDSFTFPDGICYPQQTSTKYPYNDDGSREFLDGVPFIETFIAMAAAAAVTTRLRMTTSVVKLAIRQPLIVAKQLSSLAVLSNNRIALGVGLSPWPEDFAACQVPWEGRGKRMDEIIDIIRGLMSGEYFGYEGEVFQIDPLKICPVPTQPVPILIGGHAEVALKRAARLGDGWISAGTDLAGYSEFQRKINAYRAEYGRDKLPFEYHAMTREAYSTDGVKRLEDIGVHESIVAFRDAYANAPDTSLEHKLGEINWYAENIIAKSR
ncbi:MAG: TIGR03619 family F420-dependent LLM class oxidoreductase [Pseudomonadales bacterium]|nr:TIGR03619 family F420-dependent LLM class oxidoreductase [Pseudomonadales bacterium]